MLEDPLGKHPDDHSEAVVVGLRGLALAAVALALVACYLLALLGGVAVLLVLLAGPVADARAVQVEPPLDLRLRKLRFLFVKRNNC